MEVEKRVAELEARIGDGKGFCAPSPAAELAINRYVRLLMAGRPIPKILLKQVRTLCADPPGPPSAALETIYNDVLGVRWPQENRAPRPLKQR